MSTKRRQLKFRSPYPVKSGFIITKRNRLDIIGEVKWKKAEFKDLERFNNITAGFPGRKIIIFKQGKVKDSLNAHDIINDLPATLNKLQLTFSCQASS